MPPGVTDKKLYDIFKLVFAAGGYNYHFNNGKEIKAKMNIGRLNLNDRIKQLSEHVKEINDAPISSLQQTLHTMRNIGLAIESIIVLRHENQVQEVHPEYDDISANCA